MGLSQAVSTQILPEHEGTAFPFVHTPTRPAAPTIWRQAFSKEAFLFALQHTPHRLCETTAVSRLIEQPHSVLSLMLTTITCYRMKVAQWLSEALAEHYHFSGELQNDIHTALHEAISNAVIHGNLALHRSCTDMKSLSAYYAAIATQLEHPEQRFACIALAAEMNNGLLTLRVSDEGDGYIPGQARGTFGKNHGLSIMHECSEAVRVTRGGRTVEMDFKVS